jgi:hemolysin activation/secretion protein
MHAERTRAPKPVAEEPARKLATTLAATLAVALLPLAVLAAEPVVPGAGSILQQSQPVAPPAPSPTGTGLAIEQPGAGALPPSAPFPVKAIELSGNTAFDTVTLHALIAEAEGKSLTLPQLVQIAARITDYYRSHGHPLDRAIIPPQSIEDGVVRIQIIEARYGQIVLDNHSRVVEPLLQATLAPLQSGQAISDAPLDHSLLLLADIPGVAVIATLKPGELVGTSDLQVDTAPTPAVTGNVALDNDGNRYTGRARLGGTVSLIDPVQHGDTLSATGLSSGDMDYGSLGYDWLLNGEGTRLGGSYSALHYILGDTLGPLDGHGSAEVESLWVKHPFARTPTFNMYGQIQYDHKQLDDAIGASDLHTDRHLDTGTASAAGDVRDTLLSGGVNTWSLGWSAGHLGFDDAKAQLADRRTADTQGRFSLWNATLSRLQHVTASDALYVALSGQWSGANLDPAEKMVAGGAFTVRAYDMGVLSADAGILATAEWRHELGTLWYGPMQAIGFIDSEHVSINHGIWAPGPNSASLSGGGVALNWSWPGKWNARASVAAPLGSTPTLIGTNNSARVWLSLSKGF